MNLFKASISVVVVTAIIVTGFFLFPNMGSGVSTVWEIDAKTKNPAVFSIEHPAGDRARLTVLNASDEKTLAFWDASQPKDCSDIQDNSLVNLHINGDIYTAMQFCLPVKGDDHYRLVSVMATHDARKVFKQIEQYPVSVNGYSFENENFKELMSK